MFVFLACAITSAFSNKLSHGVTSLVGASIPGTFQRRRGDSLLSSLNNSSIFATLYP